MPKLLRCLAVSVLCGLLLIGLPAPSGRGAGTGLVAVAQAEAHPFAEFWIDQGQRVLSDTGAVGDMSTKVRSQFAASRWAIQGDGQVVITSSSGEVLAKGAWLSSSRRTYFTFHGRMGDKGDKIVNGAISRNSPASSAPTSGFAYLYIVQLPDQSGISTSTHLEVGLTFDPSQDAPNVPPAGPF